MKATSRLLAAQKPWREAATLLLVAPTKVNNQSTVTYLMMKRSAKSKFMPGGIVFPGGTVAPADSSLAWSELYKAAGLQLHDLNVLSKSAHRPNIYVEDAAYRAENNLLPQELTLRIAAIRETFEECGILLGKSARETGEGDSVGNPAALQDPAEITRWQTKVKENPDEFLTLCKTLSVVPDLTSLVDWSNWVTPTTFKNRMRFDTIFYMAVIPRPLPVVFDTFEAESAGWSTATELVDKHIRGEHKLMPPQVYELSRLKDIHSLDDLRTLMDFRWKLGTERWLPSLIITTDGLLSLLPGDELYPHDADVVTELQEPKVVDSSIQKLKETNKERHRMRFLPGAGPVGADISTPPRFGHFYALPSSKI